VFSASSPEIKSAADAKSLVRFAHKYNITSLLKASEQYLVGLVLVDMSIAQAKDYQLFNTNEALVSCTALADDCNLDNLLAHCELFMIKDDDYQLWCHAAMSSNEISRSCLLRVLRGVQTHRIRSERHQNMLYRSKSTTTAPDHHVDVRVLKQWKRHALHSDHQPNIQSFMLLFDSTVADVS